MEINVDGQIFYVAESNSSSNEEQIIIDANTYIPEFLSTNDRINSITELYNILISDRDDLFEDIQEIYQDGMYKVKNYNKLSREAKLEVIKELGFSYIVDILEISDEKLTRLLTFFNLIYCLKGKDEGLDLVLKFLDLPYTYLPWYIVSKYIGSVEDISDLPLTAKEGDVYQLTNGNYYMYCNSNWMLINDPQEYATQRVEFTSELVFHADLTIKQYENMKKFFRAYMLPWINYTVDYSPSQVIFYAWGGPGIITKIIYSTVFETSFEMGRMLLIKNIHLVKTISEMENLTVNEYFTGLLDYDNV